jgi:uncharacterized protein
MRVVLDTNVFISGIHWTGDSEEIVRAWMEGKFDLVSSYPIIEELTRILSNFKVPLEPADILWWENLILQRSIMVDPQEKVNAAAHEADNKFIEAAIAGNAEYIVSQDNHLLVLKNFLKHQNCKSSGIHENN